MGLGNSPSRGDLGYSGWFRCWGIGLPRDIRYVLHSFSLLFLPFCFLPSCWGWPPTCCARPPLVEVVCRLWLRLLLRPFCVSTICPALYVSGIPHVEERWPPVVSFGCVSSIFSFQFIANFNTTDAVANLCFAQLQNRRFTHLRLHTHRVDCGSSKMLKGGRIGRIVRACSWRIRVVNICGYKL